ncbi:MAG: hypothetical protein A2487_06980 [Candidatus Raymondbacteria bacterium RifOxyC12_full_50_8]|uniref:Diphthamide synthase domain-containing protein n=1 Tax=Candidatus Raymondbacteria bacterium RIFOXYD12_FULL_49_13 TaxID=1817890 RepID=A0A1F7FCD7_UNCRA|nr:MAG: hypothetical protein A2350_00070 [Candidatus Raymondbacteria bacterium RifOxyB12_full_50_8]OGJ89566.1 MAG: hypothetical protein A2248_03375 [Candidatus Raymondbacteria bacterium RIFOXYA2_FULL_49_16]OGJ96813.1 MAG: hypothetical protein A2487_06980 [Candidatus Raymondbacteria bacterium RifOxyC12_full_50_8]OGK04308.1 MAG: hypothetical protein A2519_17830 [Candidatus Raymondbacteria bacterium RIFOXYD12_FULL_49_13]OGP42534.1 MAG: hypothetical protein A2324_17410 [Candidatus Raymondbacteria b
MGKTIFAWSSGKDSALALHALHQQQEHEIAALLTTMTGEYDRVSMHGVRKTLVEEQAQSLGYPLDIVWIPKGCSNDDYEANMRTCLEKHKQQGVTAVAFGDIFLEDLKKYREENLDRIGLRALFPIWKRNTRELAETFIASGFEAVVTCVDTKCLDAGFCGRSFNNVFLANLPGSVDPCGENGEFHTFSYAGPIFEKRIAFNTGEKVLRDERFCFCDLLPG